MEDASPGRGGDTAAVDDSAAAELPERDDPARAVFSGTEGS